MSQLRPEQLGTAVTVRFHVDILDEISQNPVAMFQCIPYIKFKPTQGDSVCCMIFFPFKGLRGNAKCADEVKIHTTL